MTKSATILLLTCAFLQDATAQPYDPPAGQPGSLAIHKDSPLFVAWANRCEVSRGPGLITFPDSVDVTYGSQVDATGMAGEGKCVSLGDGGVALIFFNRPLKDEPGPDFAVFENSFSDNFLELAFVEASSDDLNYFRFSAVSLTPTDEQVPSFGSLDAVNLYNLAGKYRGNYGTPFDLSELAWIPGLDVYAVTSLRIIDVVGTLIDSLATFDSRGNIVNDPWPTPFESGGFDLDAVGAIHVNTTLSDGQVPGPDYKIYPVPVSKDLIIENHNTVTRIMITDIRGVVQTEQFIEPGLNQVNLNHLLPGIYIINLYGLHGAIFREKLIKTG